VHTYVSYRAGTREVHNKLEKNRRAHLKECYEQLKNQLPLKEDERKKTSNLAILGEAIKYVKNLKKKDQELEAEVEQLAKTKINSQLKLVSLKRELGPKYEQMFPGPFLEFEINHCEKEHLNEAASLSSGRGSILYSSSSSLSSGGSNGSTTMSSPVGASMSLPTALSPVISKTYINCNIASSANGNNSPSNASVTSKAPGVFDHHNQQHQIKSPTSVPGNTSPSGVLSANTTVALANGAIVNVSNAALSLTAKNISAMSLTRDSPTPSTPSPSPSSSSCVSSSSSLISSSPPRTLSGIISGRNVTVSIPNNLKFASSTGLATSRVTATSGGVTTGKGTSSAAAAIIATSPPNNNGVTSNNNAIMLQALRGCHLV
ncbi:PREDICTED: max-binding protein MNT, partial [Rhagoletis zephyria]|uniref:max-binding protein MNT n=1 Tax=Rhagoletis zephyria TaxID=28612 RepID=UPI0008113AD6